MMVSTTLKTTIAKDIILSLKFSNKKQLQHTIRFFNIRKSDALLSDYLIDLKLHKINFVRNCNQWNLN